MRIGKQRRGFLVEGLDRGKRRCVGSEFLLGRQVQQDVDRINRETEALIRSREIEVNEEIKAVENQVRLQALIIPPLLPLAVGLMVLGLRLLGEQRGIARERMVKGMRK